MDARALIVLFAFAMTSSVKTQSVAVFSFSGAEEGRRFGCSAMTARDIGLRKSAFPKDGSRGGRRCVASPRRADVAARERTAVRMGKKGIILFLAFQERLVHTAGR